MANAQWCVNFYVEFANGNGQQMGVYLASPDLKNTKEAKKRARETARVRLFKKIQRDYKYNDDWMRKISILCISVECVG